MGPAQAVLPPGPKEADHLDPARSAVHSFENFRSSPGNGASRVAVAFQPVAHVAGGLSGNIRLRRTTPLPARAAPESPGTARERSKASQDGPRDFKRASGPRDGRESLPGRLPKALDEAKSARVQPAKPGRDPEETPRGTRRGFQEAHVFEMPKENHTSLTILPFRFRWAVKPQAANKAAADVPGGLSKNIWPTTTVLIFGMAPLVWR